MLDDEHEGGGLPVASARVTRAVRRAGNRSALLCALLVLAGCSLDFDGFRSDAGPIAGHPSGGSEDAGHSRDAAELTDIGHGEGDGGGADASDSDAAPEVPADAGPDASDACEVDCGMPEPEPPACASKPCGAHADCEAAAKAPGYACACRDGYVLDGGECKNIDECFEGTHACHPSATCEDNDGSYDCTCPLGYVGGGIEGIACTSRIVAAEQSTCVVQLDGHVLCWGTDNRYGTLGDGTMVAHTEPALVVGLTDVVGLTGGVAYAMCALISDGTVKCWGSFLGGTYTDAVTRPTEVEGLNDVVALDVGSLSACAVVRGGTVQCWGQNDQGQLGDGMTSTTPRATPAPVDGLTDVVSVAVGQQRACAIVKDGKVRCWGRGTGASGTTESSTTPVAVVGLSGVIELTAGEQHHCALLGNRQVQCWPSAASAPKTVAGIRTAIHLNAGTYESCALLDDGTVLAWFGGDFATLPDGTDSMLFDGNVAAVTGAGDTPHMCALMNDGTVACAGASTAPVVVQDLDLW